MSHRQIGLAGAGRADAEDHFGPFQRAHIGVLVERTGIDHALARRNLGGGDLTLALHGRQCQLVVAGDRHAHGAVNVRLADIDALLQDAIERIQRAARLLGGRGRAFDGELVAARADVDAELLLETGQVLVELAVKGAGKLVVVEGQYDVRHVGGPGCLVLGRILQLSSAQPSLLICRGRQASSANRLLWPVFVIRTSIMSPISPALSSTITGSSHGDRPTFW